ncbi:hypothetical protein [Herbaspirillum autotrophicum]|uniref:hypothetical protein n=1 Tax=Herbaspirillum autotrophicum TaxID=180195 RepID=UPI000B0A82ED|nr:hypothetical protein [Herbaspirillum autotrophicum]
MIAVGQHFSHRPASEYNISPTYSVLISQAIAASVYNHACANPAAAHWLQPATALQQATSATLNRNRVWLFYFSERWQ